MTEPFGKGRESSQDKQWTRRNKSILSQSVRALWNTQKLNMTQLGDWLTTCSDRCERAGKKKLRAGVLFSASLGPQSEPSVEKDPLHNYVHWGGRSTLGSPQLSCLQTSLRAVGLEV